MKDSSKHIVLVAGGTGGHVYPALATADILKAIGYQTSFITDPRGKIYFGNQAAFCLHLKPLQQPSLFGKLQAVVLLCKAVIPAFHFFRAIKPQYVIAFGGYPAFPASIAAKLLGIPLYLHEQNAVLGQVNRWLGYLAKYIFLSFPETEHITSCLRKKTILMGTPMRSIVDVSAAPQSGTQKTIVIVGGSQGARIFSQIIPAAIEKLTVQEQSQLHIIQQCRPDDLPAVEQTYRRLKLHYQLAPFFSNMHVLLQEADFVISRSGASSLAELMAFKKPCLLIPFAAAKDNHQVKNAAYIAHHQRAWVMEEAHCTSLTLAQFFKDYLAGQKELKNQDEPLIGFDQSHIQDVLAKIF